MRIKQKNVLRILFFALIVCIGSSAQLSAQDTSFKSVPDGTKMKMKGIITSRGSDSLMMRDIASSDMYYVDLTGQTKVATYKKLIRGGKPYASSYLLRGLRIQVSGLGNSSGHIVADTINFDEDDLRTAQALQVTVDPVEAKAAKNAAEIAAQEANAKKMEGQIDENAAMAASAKGTADEALLAANRANNRINGLDDYDQIKTISVPFATGSFTLGPVGRRTIDDAAEWVKTQNTKGWMVAVVGFADSTGNTARNKTLSEKRANAVIGYLVSRHNLPLTRLVQPFGAGVDDPIATNSTASGRAQNRRVEIRLLVNKGIAG